VEAVVKRFEQKQWTLLPGVAFICPEQLSEKVLSLYGTVYVSLWCDDFDEVAVAYQNDNVLIDALYVLLDSVETEIVIDPGYGDEEVSFPFDSERGAQFLRDHPLQWEFRRFVIWRPEYLLSLPAIYFNCTTAWFNDAFQTRVRSFNGSMRVRCYTIRDTNILEHLRQPEVHLSKLEYNFEESDEDKGAMLASINCDRIIASGNGFDERTALSLVGSLQQGQGPKRITLGFERLNDYRDFGRAFIVALNERVDRLCLHYQARSSISEDSMQTLTALIASARIQQIELNMSFVDTRTRQKARPRL